MNVAVFGQSGTGKSTFASNLVAYLHERNKKVVAISDNVDDLSRVADALDEDFVYVEVTDQNFSSLNYENIVKKYQFVAFEFVNVLSDEIENVMDRICSTIYELGNTIVYIDEAHLFLPRFHSSVEAQRMIRGGRKHAITNIIVTQQLSDLVDVALKQAHYMVIFKMTQHRELEVLKVYVDIELVKDLELYECLVLDRITGEVYKISNSEFVWEVGM